MTAATRMRVLLVDDEPLARANLRSLLEGDTEVEIVGECSSGRAALEALRVHEVDLVFLDVQMPRVSGLEVLRRLGPERAPLVVFATAHDHYALRAFEAQALDYLLKPFDDARFAAALARAKTRWRQGRDASLGRRLQALLGGADDHGAAVAPTDHAAPPPRERLVVKDGRRVVRLDLARLDRVEAAGYVARLHAGDEVFTLRASLDTLERRLAPAGFVRVHRSALVRLDRIAEVRTTPGASEIVLDDGARVPLSRRRRAELERRLADGRGD